MSRHRIEVVVVADDLTGAADTGVQFCKAAGPVHLRSVDPPRAVRRSAAVPRTLALFTDSRHLDPPAAAERLRHAAKLLQKWAPRVVYKKIDSCLRGNVGREIEVLMEDLDIGTSFIAPALPSQGRTTAHDIHRVWGEPLGQSETAADPISPVTESRLSHLIAGQSRLPVGRIDLADVAAGAERLRAVIDARMAAGCRHITFDATETVHLDTIAAVADRIQDDVILVGSAGLAARQAARLESSATGPFPPERLQRMLWICGSASALAARQIRALSERTSVVPVDLTAAQLAASTAERVALIDRVTTGWRRGVLLLRIAPGGAGLYDDPRALTGGIAKLAAAAVVRTQPDGIFLTGGDTAAAVWRHLGASAVRLAGEVLPGVIWGTWVGGAMAARPVITKAGAFGAPETLLRLYRRLMAS